jgi:hypothetical protein
MYPSLLQFKEQKTKLKNIYSSMLQFKKQNTKLKTFIHHFFSCQTKTHNEKIH